MNETTNTNSPAGNPGRGLGIGGFIISLVGLVCWIFVAGAAGLAAIATPGGGTGTMIFWIVLCAVGLLLSFMGFRKSSAAGAKKGLAVAGIILGLVALILSIYSLIGLRELSNDPQLQKSREELKNALDEGMKEMKENMEHMDDDTTNHDH